MSDFIQGDDFKRNGGEAEEVVWNSVKSALRNRNILGYSRYPLFFKKGEKRKEPDILLLDKEIGIIVIEVKAFNINDIQSVEANHWSIKNNYEIAVNPIAQAEDYLYALKGKFDVDRELRGKYKGKLLVALPNINKKEFMDKGFLKTFHETMFIFKDDLTDSKLFNKIVDSTYLFDNGNFTNNGFRIAKSILGHEQNHVDNLESYLPEGTKGEIYSKFKKRLYDLEIQQERIAKSIAPGPQRIRGIAGSGKTLLICQKAAYMHLRHPEWKIAISFFTQSLYDNIKSVLDMYIKAFTNGEESYAENSNLMVLHAWGGKYNNGLYREIARRNGCKFWDANNVKNALGGFTPPDVSINYISKLLLEEKAGNLEEIFDAIFIDEGQDLVGDNEYKYEGKQSFYYMAYKSLKPINSDDGKELRRLIWAYDELQSLNDTKIPSSKEVLGDTNLVTGTYKGGIRKSEIMRKCYRTPHQILTASHAIGMGLLRKEGMLTGYTTQRDWENIGYKVVKGDFRKEGNEIILERPIENSPNPISEIYKGNCFEFEMYNTESEVFERLAANIKKDIEIEKLNPSRDILVVHLKELYDDNYLELIGQALNSKGIKYYVPTCSISNIVRDHWQNKKPDKFWDDGSVTISSVVRAKGNEAPMVYVVGVEYIATKENNISLRNRLYTALTRAKCWVKLMGVGSYSLYNEIEKAIESNGRFEFIYKKPIKESNDNELD